MRIRSVFPDGKKVIIVFDDNERNKTIEDLIDFIRKTKRYFDHLGNDTNVRILTFDGFEVFREEKVCDALSESETYKIQELHLPIYHYLCAETEAHFFDK